MKKILPAPPSASKVAKAVKSSKQASPSATKKNPITAKKGVITSSEKRMTSLHKKRKAAFAAHCEDTILRADFVNRIGTEATVPLLERKPPTIRRSSLLVEGMEIRPAWELTYGKTLRTKPSGRSPASPPGAEAAAGAESSSLLVIPNASLYPWNCTVWIVATDATGRRWGGTGWFISPRLIVTAGHVVFPGGGGGQFMRELVIFPGHDGTGDPEGILLHADSMRAAQGWRSSGAREVDYGGILIPNSIPASPAWYGGANQAMVPVFVVGYPVDGSVTNGTLWYGQGSLKPEENPTRDDDQWYYEISTRSGQSGGPVFYYDAGSKLAYAIGIHNYGDSPYNFGTRLTTQVLQELASWIP